MDGDATYTVDDLLGWLADLFAKYGIEPMTRHERRRYGREITDILHEPDTDMQEMVRVFKRVVYRNAAEHNPYRLSPLNAHRDELGGKPMPEKPESRVA